MAYANTEDDVNTPFTGGPTPGRKVLLTPRDFELLDNAVSPLTPPDSNPNRRVDSDRKVVESPSIIQLARNRLMRSLRRTVNIMTYHGRSQAWAGGSELLIFSLTLTSDSRLLTFVQHCCSVPKKCGFRWNCTYTPCEISGRSSSGFTSAILISGWTWI